MKGYPTSQLQPHTTQPDTGQLHQIHPVESQESQSRKGSFTQADSKDVSVFAGVSSVELDPTNYSQVFDSIRREQEKRKEQLEKEQEKRKEQLEREVEEAGSWIKKQMKEERNRLQQRALKLSQELLQLNK